MLIYVRDVLLYLNLTFKVRSLRFENRNSKFKLNIFYVSAVKESDVDDVRDVLSYYKQFDDPIAVFRENQRKLQEETLAYEEKLKKETQTKSFSGFTGLSFMRRR